MGHSYTYSYIISLDFGVVKGHRKPQGLQSPLNAMPAVRYLCGSHNVATLPWAPGSINPALVKVNNYIN